MDHFNLTGLSVSRQGEELQGHLVDIKGPEVVEVSVCKSLDNQGRTLWVNVCGVCVLRIHNAGKIEIA